MINHVRVYTQSKSIIILNNIYLRRSYKHVFVPIASTSITTKRGVIKWLSGEYFSRERTVRFRDLRLL